MASIRTTWALAAVVPLLGACTGEIGGEDAKGTSTAPLCTSPHPGTAPMRRLSNAEYRNTVSDLLGDDALASAVVAPFSSETESLGFRNSARFLTVPTVVAQQYMDAAEKIAAVASKNPALVPCSPTAMAPRACAEQFVRTFGAKAFRRPVTEAEVTTYLAQYDGGADATNGFNGGLEFVIFTMLQSPSFLYRVEFGAPSFNGVARPTSYEMASRLSYLLWQSMPDQALFDLAAKDGLATKEAVADQARRMLKDPKAKRMFEFFSQWLSLDQLPAMQRDASVYPDATPALSGLLGEEAHSFVDHVMWEKNGDFNALMTAPYTFINADLAKHYGVSGPSGSAFEQVTLGGRAGILTLGGVVSAHDKSTRTSIVRRGLKVRTGILCQTVGAPPAKIPPFPPAQQGVSQADRLAEHRKNPACASCHDRMDPLGVVFEGFDAVGRARTKDELGNPIATKSEVTLTEDANGPVADPVELATRLAGSDEVRECFATQAFRFFYGRGEETEDACTQDEIKKAFASSNYSMIELIVALTQTDAALYMTPVVPGGGQ